MSNTENNTYLIAGSIIIAGLLIAVGVFMSDGSSEKTPDNNQDNGELTTEDLNIAPITENDHIKGELGADLTIVEYSDFQCPFCSRFHPTLQQVLTEYDGDVRWVYKHFPLTQIHPEALPSAEASECAAEQAGSEGFWAYADALFENQTSLGSDLYESLASDMGLNISQFRNCMEDHKYRDKVQADQTLGVKNGVTGTPGAFVNGQALKGAVPYEQVKALIEAELEN